MLMARVDLPRLPISRQSRSWKRLEGIEFSNGQVVIHWLTDESSLGVYDTIDTALRVYGRDGWKDIVWFDPRPSSPDDLDDDEYHAYAGEDQ
jgi:hypothetical protein